MKFNLVITGSSNKTDILHTQAFLDPLLLIKCGLEALHHKVIVGDRLLKNYTNIVFGYHLLYGKSLPRGYDIIIYQFEQFPETNSDDPYIRELKMNFVKTLRTAKYVWDYSKENIEFLHSHGINAIYKPLGFHENMYRIKPKPVKDVDVLFYGTRNERRVSVLNEINRKYNLAILFGTYGQERDECISRAKIVLNVHFYESKLFDEIRTTFLMNNKIFTILEDTPFRKYAECLVYSDYNRFVETCDFYLQNETLMADKAQEAFDVFSQYPEAMFLEKALSETF